MRAPHCRVLVLCLLSSPVVLPAQAPQDAQDTPAFRSRISVVEVDAFVTDGSGAFVRGLTKDDFEIFDDGVRQDISSVTAIDLPTPSGPQPWRAAITDDVTRTHTGETIPPASRVYALLLNGAGGSCLRQAQLGPANRVQTLARQFLEVMAPEDVMSVYVVREGAVLAQELTSSWPLLRRAIRCPTDSRPDTPAMGLPARAAHAGYRALRDVAEDLGTVSGRRKAILWIGARASFHPSSAEEALDYRDAIRAATRHNVAIHPIDLVGLTTRLGMGELQRLGGLRAVAEDTGGIAVVGTNNFSGGFERIVAADSAYYLLGYSPSVDHDDGRFHRIEVRVRRPGLSVRARRGYFAAEAAPPPPVVEPVELSAAAHAVATLGGTGRDELLHVRASSLMAGNARALWIVGELDMQASRESRWAGGATAEVALMSGDGTTRYSGGIELTAGNSVFVIRVPDGIELPPGDYRLRTRLTAGNATSLTDTQRIRILDKASPLGEAVLWRRGPTTGRRDLRTADGRFRRTEQLRLDLPTRSEAPAAARLLDRTGSPLPIPLQVTERREDALIWLVVQVPLAPLAPADYVVEVTQDGSRQLTPFRIVP